MDRTTETQKSGKGEAESSEPGKSLVPTEAEVEAWAERVRLRRQSWVDGPTEEEKHEWQRRERARRAERMELETVLGTGDASARDAYEVRIRLQRRYIREARLAAEGFGVLFFTLPSRVLSGLVNAGQEWEEKSLRPARRRWIPLDDDEV